MARGWSPLRACAALYALAAAAHGYAIVRVERSQLSEINETSSMSNSTDAPKGEPADCPPLVSRAEWGARNATAIEYQPGPVRFVIIHHTYIPGACNSSTGCEAAMRSMQRFHQVDRGWFDIGYHFVIGGDGRVYVGRGWGVVGAHAPHYNTNGIGISFIGDYRTSAPPENMTALAHHLIECGVQRGSIQPDYKLMGHRQVRATECPGDAFFEQVTRWPHWVPNSEASYNATATAAATNSTTTSISITTSTTTTTTTAQSPLQNEVLAGVPEGDGPQVNEIAAESSTAAENTNTLRSANVSTTRV